MVRLPPIVSLGAALVLAAASAAAQVTSTTSNTTTSTPAPTAAPTSCAAGLQMFVARGTTEAPGLGRIGVVARNISERIKDSSITAVDYPATYLNYNTSVADAANQFRSLISDYVTKCPDGKIALLGYSQGAQALGDAICGVSEVGFTATHDLGPEFEKNLVAIVLYGDPSRTPNQTWDAGTATNQSGLFPRQNNSACEPYGNVMRSWCDVGDVYCANGNLSQVHGSYFNKYTNQTTDWVVARFNNATQPSGPTTTTTAGSSASGSGGVSATASSPPRNGASPLARAASCPASLAVALALAYLLIV